MDLFHQFPLIVQLLIKALLVVSVLMGACMYSVLAERKVSAWIQGRPGPNRTAIPWIAAIPVIGRFLQRLGVFQPLADGGKFLFKEEPIPGHVKWFYFNLAPLVALIPALTTVLIVPFGEYVDAAGRAVPLILANLDLGIVFMFAISSLGVYSTILAGWASNSRYPFLGSVRATAQLISYEIAMSLSVIPLFLLANNADADGTLSLIRIVQYQGESCWFVFLAPISALVFYVSLFAETNRLPFDMPEGEAELVGGFHTEYGAFKFGLFFTAEYAHMIVGSAVFSLLFLGGWQPLPGITWAKLAAWTSLPLNLGLLGALLALGTLLLKVAFFVFVFIWVRWTVPRFRYDQVMRLGWRVLMPLALANIVAYAVIIALLPN
ncbi:MAG: NADH-quinone oxidoreductase subunit H [Opitutaceae bacterium]